MTKPWEKYRDERNEYAEEHGREYSFIGGFNEATEYWLPKVKDLIDTIKQMRSHIGIGPTEVTYKNILDTGLAALVKYRDEVGDE